MSFSSIRTRSNSTLKSKPLVSLIVKWTPSIGHHASRHAFVTSAGIAMNRVIAYLLTGENVIFETHNVLHFDMRYRRHPGVAGTLFITNCHLIFSRLSKKDTIKYMKIPLMTISNYEISSQKSPNNQTAQFLTLFCKDLRTVKLGFGNDVFTRNKVVRVLDALIFVPYPLKFFAFYYEHAFQSLSDYSKGGWSLFNIFAEFHRQKIPTRLWRVTSVNQSFKYCRSYPRHLIVPADMPDNDLLSVFEYRSKGRIPVLTYYHHASTAALIRCAQPMVGITRQRKPEDEKLFETIRTANTVNSSVLTLIDARPRRNAIANHAIGAGYEDTSEGGGYTGCRIEFVGIENIHVMRVSLQQVQAICERIETIEKWYTALDNTRWLDHIRTLIVASSRIAALIAQEKISVVVHCSDGWDRTSQLVALAQIMLDPFFRTITGFEILISKDFCSFGHKFAQRCGHGDPNYNDDQRAPIFLQFVDCVWQLLHQFPTAFQFNETFLISILDHLYSCQFGTFLFNSEMVREQMRVSKTTVSLWAFLNEDFTTYTNPFYLPDLNRVLVPTTTMDCFQLWGGYYLRWFRATGSDSAVRAGLSMQQKYQKLVRRSFMLEQHLVEMKKAFIHCEKEDETAQPTTSAAKEGGVSISACPSNMTSNSDSISPDSLSPPFSKPVTTNSQVKSVDTSLEPKPHLARSLGEHS